MAKGAHSSTVQGWLKVGQPRSSKKKKGNTAARTSKRGNGKKLR